MRDLITVFFLFGVQGLFCQDIDWRKLATPVFPLDTVKSYHPDSSYLEVIGEGQTDSISVRLINNRSDSIYLMTYYRHVEFNIYGWKNNKWTKIW